MKVGVIGLGRWGKNVFNEYQNLKKDEYIDDVCSCDIVSDADYTDYKKMLPDIDAVHICVQNKYHYQVVKDCLLAKKHVLVEKPITQTKVECQKLILYASERGLVLQVGHLLRFSNIIKMVKELVDSGEFSLDKLQYISIHWTAKNIHHQNVDIIWDFLPHPLDAIYYLYDMFPDVENSCVLRNNEKTIATLQMSYGNIPCHAEFSWCTPIKQRRMKLYTNNAVADISFVPQKLTITRSGNVINVPIRENRTVYYEAVNFIESIKSGENKTNSHIIGLQNTECIEKILEKK